MPVIGHAFAGLAMGLCTKPTKPAHPSSKAATLELWLTVTICLAYLPDSPTFGAYRMAGSTLDESFIHLCIYRSGRDRPFPVTNDVILNFPWLLDFIILYFTP